ncbi:ATP-dependent endonuclease of the OLD family-like protein [Nostoc punctiforme PCC 73102]|uniref:ATP-dependent endonuclease of the OLD family-like protein n=1 Tax=Nostoc punctiforme (strain ATCC 29133 / PCC 73102) TaxID=63737 RepID=B2J5Y6_NOSP7|nr:ATP-dependent endonuclease of the OLD family-like protein [Nostoc punctiforme PCC 73102]
MYLKTVFIRFYKSFNDDFIRKNNNKVKPKPWEKIDNAFYPYIEVPLDPKITTIVGANESGKSHLLSAIEKAISGNNIERSDFCRYSHFFTVKQNELKYPDFGTEWSDLSKSEEVSLRKIIEIPENIIFDRFLVFRRNISNIIVYLPEKGDYRPYRIGERQVSELQSLLPEILRIESDVALPSSVPIKKLVHLGQEKYLDSRRFELLDREQRNRIVDALDEFSDNPELVTKVRLFWGENKDVVDPDAIETMKSIISALDEAVFSLNEKERRDKETNLAYKLICKIAQVDTNALLDLAGAIKKGMQGYANGIIEKINRQLSINLNFPNYWVQDRNFCLKVMARDYDLVFTITDRTGTEYSFEERSQGLRYFLSYYIQYRSHEPHPNKTEILLMDEPDAYLSSQAQQDLLKVFDLFAIPAQGSHLTHPIQVVYVTHSPFLIDKNHAERIRVLRKGNEDEGTRVVKDAAKNHYEPLRSSIGAYVGETAFIGNCNLMVEGISDQILIAGATTYLRANGAPNLETLDLNQITIVQSGSASHIPYLVYLARGRDVEQPAVIVLLDSDNSGNEAKKQLLGKGGQHRRPVLKEQFILQLTDLKEEFSLVTDPLTVKIEIEDIIPLSICIQATKFYLKEFLQLDETEFCFLTEDLVLKKLANQTILDAIQASLLEFPDKGLQINKVGFARNVIQVVNEWKQKRDSLDKHQSDALQVFEKNFRVLFKKLNIMQRRARQRLTDERLSQKIERLKKDFIALHPISARREDGVILLDEIEVILENNIENEAIKEIEAIKNALQNLRRDYKLEIDMSKTIDDYIGFQKGLEIIKYAGLLASQEETPDEPQAKKSATSESEEVPEKVHIDNLIVDEHQQVIIEQVPTISEVKIAEVSNNSTKANQRRKSRIRS